MRIGFYIATRNLNPFTIGQYLEGKVGLSGTHGQLLQIALELHKIGYDVFIYCQHNLTFDGQFNVRHSSTLKDAIKKCKVDDRCDIVIFNDSANDETIDGILACDNFKMTAIVWNQNGPYEHMADLLQKATYVKRVVCVSAIQSDYLRDHPVFDKIYYIYNSIDTSLYSSMEKIKNSVCFLGSLTPSKGFHHLAKAWKQVRASIPDANLHVIGSAKLYNNKQRLGRLGVSTIEYENELIIPFLGESVEIVNQAGVNFYGLMNTLNLRALIGQMEVGVVNPNIKGSTETFCVSAIELQACGAVTIGANKGGLKETINDGETGILIKDEKELATSIIKLLEQRKMLLNYSLNARNWVEKKFDTKNIIGEWEKLIDDVLVGRKNREQKFSIQRATWSVVLRQGIRVLRKSPFGGDRVPTLLKTKEFIHSKFKRF